MLVMSEPIFVGRAYEQQCYQALLKGDVRWLLIVTGQGGIGKSTLLRRFREITPAGTAVVSLNFADIALRTDALAILGELAEQVKQYCQPKQLHMFEKSLLQGRNELAIQSQMHETIIAREHAVVQGNQLSMSGIEQRRQIREKVRKAFNDLLDTLRLATLVLLLDTCEWLNEAESSEVGQWMLQSVLPKLHERLCQKRRQCVAVIASRFLLDLAAIDEQERRHLVLLVLERAAVDDYLRHIGMQDRALHQRVYDLTHGQALCVSIIATLWQERPFSIADLPLMQEQFTEQALLKFVGERILDKRLKSPFRELTRYGIVLRSFNLPTLQAVFPDLHIEYEQFSQFIRYPYIEAVGNRRHATHGLLREILAEEIREQEPEQWQIYHKRAQKYFTTLQPPQSDRYYHAIELSQEEGMSDWWDAIQSASFRRDQEEFTGQSHLNFDSLKL